MSTVGLAVLVAGSLALPQQPIEPKPEHVSLKVPTITFAIAASADWITTYQADKRGAKEQNPLYAWADGHSALQATVIAASDVVGVWAWNKYVGRKHPKVATIGLYAMAGVRVWLAIGNSRACRPTCK